MVTRCDPGQDVFIVPRSRGHPSDPSGSLIPGSVAHRVAGKMGIDATVKSRGDPDEYKRAWPRGWGEQKLADYLGD